MVGIESEGDLSHMSDATHVYLGTLTCGCTVAALVDLPEQKRVIAKALARMIRDGYTISRVTIAECRKTRIAHCLHTPRQQGLLL